MDWAMPATVMTAFMAPTKATWIVAVFVQAHAIFLFANDVPTGRNGPGSLKTSGQPIGYLRQMAHRSERVAARFLTATIGPRPNVVGSLRKTKLLCT
jgi:hypothetical protein